MEKTTQSSRHDLLSEENKFTLENRVKHFPTELRKRTESTDPALNINDIIESGTDEPLRTITNTVLMESYPPLQYSEKLFDDDPGLIKIMDEMVD